MMQKALVLDTKTLICAVVDRRVRDLSIAYAPTVQFFAPDAAYTDARKYLPMLLRSHNVDPMLAMSVLDWFEVLIRPLDADLYGVAQAEALRRISARDSAAWPVLASALVIGCPVWTEDTDLFGTGVATWSSDKVALYLA